MGEEKEHGPVSSDADKTPAAPPNSAEGDWQMPEMKSDWSLPEKGGSWTSPVEEARKDAPKPDQEADWSMKGRDASWSMSEKPAYETPLKSQGAADKPQQLPPLVLALVGLAVVDGVVVLIMAGLWFTNFELLTRMLQGRATITMIMGLAAIILGAVVLQKNRSAGTSGPATMWANIAVAAGFGLCFITIGLPLVATLRAMMGVSSPP